MDAWVQCLDPSVEAFGEAGDIGHLSNSKPCFGDGLGRGAGRHDLDPCCGKLTREVDESGLVIDRDKRTADGALVTHEGSPIRRDSVVTRSARS